MAVLDSKTSLWMHRMSMIEEMGFNAADAAKLEKAVKTISIKERRYEVPISWHDVAKLIEAGATQEQVLRILL